MVSDPDKLRKEAQSIASKSREPKQAWKELRDWASENGPMAMEVAVHEFLTNYGRDPKIAALMPGIMHRVSVMPLGKQDSPIIRKQESQLAPSLSMNPRSNLSLSKEKPSPVKPLDISITPADPVSMRDIPLRIHEGMKQSLRLPMNSDEVKSKKRAAKRAIAAGKGGEEIVRSMVEHVSYHGTGARLKRKKKTVTKRSRKKKVNPTLVRKKVRTPVGKKKPKTKPRAKAKPPPRKKAKPRAKAKAKPRKTTRRPKSKKPMPTKRLKTRKKPKTRKTMPKKKLKTKRRVVQKRPKRKPARKSMAKKKPVRKRAVKKKPLKRKKARRR